MAKAAAGASSRGDADASKTVTATEAYRIPVLDKAIQMLELIRGEGEGLSLNAIVDATGVARSTVYRVLNTFTSHGIVSRRSDGRYHLGLKLVTLAANVQTAVSREDLVELCHARLERLAEETEETCKVSVLSGLKAEVIDVAQSPNELAPTSRVGSSFSLHAGAASKLLLAYQPVELLDRLLEQPLQALTPKTITGRKALKEELGSIRHSELSFDKGEWNVNVHAVAAPVFAHGKVLVAALSVTHFATGDTDERQSRIIDPLRQAAAALSSSLGYVEPDK